MKKLPDSVKEANAKAIDLTSGTRQLTREKKGEKALRYDAQIIAAKHGKPLQDAMEIAKTALAAKVTSDNRSKGRKRNETLIRVEKRSEGRRRRENIFAIHGKPVSGGLPGLGKRK